eukprot:TRINITY_DN16138_c0_g1_i1.p1 TRINITY_DN16138_c0_g1~~TRINITY_DN16138_c0_g1_i1.p1  ORF type:complete len:154 (+),score=34.72 TRINITY_DN16138_c0_g1_i1:72-464(+)
MSKPEDQKSVVASSEARDIGTTDVPISSTSPEARARAHASEYDKLAVPVLLGRLKELGADPAAQGLHEKEELVALMERLEPSKVHSTLPPPAEEVSTDKKEAPTKMEHAPTSMAAKVHHAAGPPPGALDF